jgi:dipeptidyl aminopeptidase/acylaminoacyl peptidase
MRRTIALLTTLLALAVGVPVRASAPDDLLVRMAAVNAGLRSFTATMHADVSLRTFPFLGARLVGTYYFKQPDKTKIVFTEGLPAIAQQFDKLYAHIETPAHWSAVYAIATLSDDGTTTRFKLVPRTNGNVDRIEARVDDKSATVTSMRWNYKNGGFAEMTNRYREIDGNMLVSSQTGHVEEPGYVADITSTIDGYHLNVPIADSTFDGQ